LENGKWYLTNFKFLLLISNNHFPIKHWTEKRFKIMNSKKPHRGQTLVEIMVAVAVFGLIAGSLLILTLNSLSSSRQGGERTKAQALAEEGIDAAYSIRERAWNELVNGNHGVDDSAGYWQFSGTSNTIDQYTRVVTVEDVYRDVSGDIAVAGTLDLHTKKITSTVTWDVEASRSNEVELVSYFTTWQSADWTQTDWVGGDGQSIWSDTTKYNSDDGGVDVNTAGQVTLDQTLIATGSNDWPFDTAGNYTYDSDKIEVTGGVAQLKSLGGGASDDTNDDGFEYTTDTSYDWPFTTAGNYTYDSDDIEVTGGVAQLKASGGATVSGGTLNETFDSNTDNWTYNDWSQGGGDPDATGTWYASNGNPNGYVDVNLPYNLKNKMLGGYWEQSFTTTVDNPDTVTCEIDWRAFTATLPSEGVDELYVAIYLETVSGEPATTAVLQKDFTSTFDWEVHSGGSAVDCSSYVTTAGTYYYKVAVWIDGTNKNTGSINVGFDNAKVYWEHTTGGSYPTNEPDIYPTASYSAPGVQSWDSFTETATKNGGEIYYQLSDDDGSTWYYWGGSSWDTVVGATDYNTASVVNTNISSFSTTNEQIKFKAFLESDGTQQVQLDNVNIGLTPHAAVWNFNTWDIGGGEVTPTGTRQTSGGNPDSYTDVTVPVGQNDEIGGYWEQSFTTTVANPSVDIDFDYKVIDFNGIPDVAEIRVYVDTVTGDPVTQVGSSITVSSEGTWTSATTIDASSAVTTTGTYYLKIVFWVETPGAGGAGPFTVGFDNVNLAWQGPDYSPDQPTIYNTSSFTPAVITTWTSFIETATKNGGEIYYQLSDDDGSNWQYWDGDSWENDPDGDEGASENDYNIASTVNSYINQFDVSNKKFMFKAFLVGDGSQQVQLDNIEVTYDITSANYYGSSFVIDSTSGIGLMNKSTDWTSLRFTAKNSKTVSAVRIYLQQEKGTSPTYRYGLQSDNGGEPSGTWLGATNQGYGDHQATATGWQTISLNESVTLSAGTTYHLLVRHQSGTINSANSIELRRSDPDNFLHPYDGSSNPASNVLWSDDNGATWSVQGYQPIYVLDFSDATYEGNPYHELTVRDIYSTDYFGQQFTITGSDTIISTIGFLVSENNEGPEDDLYVTLYDVTGATQIESGTLATDADMTNNIYSWETYTFSSPITLTSGNTYRVYLSSPLSTIQKHYVIRTIHHDNVSVLNGINYSGTNSVYTYSTDSGSSWTATDNNYDINGFRFATTIYELSGYLISSAYDTGSLSSFNIIEWTQTTPSCTPACETKIQIQTAPDNVDSPGAWSATWCGPDGEDGDDTDYFTNSAGELIHSDHNGDQWIRYKAILSGDSTDTPTFEEITINYTP